MMKNKPLGFWLGFVALVGGALVFWMSSGIGQMPAGKPAQSEVRSSNPLRADHPVAIPGAIRQTALQGEETLPAPATPMPPAAQSSAAQVPTAQPLPNLTEFPGAGAAAESAEPMLAAAPAVPGAPIASAVPVITAQPTAALPNVDPFAGTDPFGEPPMVAFDASAVHTPVVPHTSAVPTPIAATPIASGALPLETATPAPLGGAHFPETHSLGAGVPETTIAFELPDSVTPSPLDSADPFAQRQPAATVPSHALVTAQPTAEPVAQAGQPLEPLRTAASLPPMAVQQPRNEGTGMPGAANLEGLQTPHLTLQKVLPEEVVIDQPATLRTVINNTGNSIARNITITDRVPQGTRLLSTTPEAAMSPDGELRWVLGNLDPNVQLAVEMRVLPLREGEIGSVASVTHTGEASGRIVVTRPMLKVEVNAPAEVRLGETAMVEIIVSNPGTATVTNVVVEERVPDGLFHRDGRIMRHEGITALRPKETKKLTLPLLCTGSGNLVNHVIVTADGDLMVEDRTTIRALAPILELEIVGARSRFLERRSDYRLIVANKGNDAARDVALEVALPRAVQFVSTNQSGVYESSTHTVHWALEELPAQEAGEIELVVVPIQTGEHSLRFTGTGANNLKAEAALPVSIDGIPAITFEIVGDSNLVELGKDVAYEIRIANRGTKAAENVRVQVALAEGLTFVKAEGGRAQATQGGLVQFDAIPLLAAKSESVFKLTARSQTEGDHRINVQVISNDLRSPITKEESTRVFK